MYQIFKAETGFPIMQFDTLRVCREGIFLEADSPRVNDVFTITSPLEAVTYVVTAVGDLLPEEAYVQISYQEPINNE